MKRDGGHGKFRYGRVALHAWQVFVAIALATATIAVAFSSDAQAQERRKRWWDLRTLFVPEYREIPAPRVLSDPSELPRVKAQRAKEAAAKRKKKAAKTAPETVTVVKSAEARTIMVVGDFVGSALAEGLSAAYADNPDIVVIDRTRRSSGLVRDDPKTWTNTVDALIDKEKPAAILLVVGANDRQQMTLGETSEPVRSNAWTDEYQKRSEALARTLSRDGQSFLWFGLPAFKSTKINDDVLAFNEAYRTATIAAGGQFVDVWDGFVDENGSFVTNGPDISGQPTKLRTSDGINFTRAGKRKLAFYAEKPIEKALGVSSVNTAAIPEEKAAPDSAPSADRTQPMSIEERKASNITDLLGAPNEVVSKRSAEGSSAIIGIGRKAVPGRADNFLAVPPANGDKNPAATAAP